MSKKGSITTSDYVDWSEMKETIKELYRQGDYRMSLFLACGSYFGLRVSDLRLLTWDELLSDRICLTEKKTGKHREFPINSTLEKHVRRCYKALGLPDRKQYAFLSQKGVPYRTQSINRKLKRIKSDFELDVEHFSTHSLRKTFGRRVISLSKGGSDTELTLIKLCEIFNHSTPMITRRYLGLRKQELGEIYKSL